MLATQVKHLTIRLVEQIKSRLRYISRVEEGKQGVAEDLRIVGQQPMGTQAALYQL